MTSLNRSTVAQWLQLKGASLRKANYRKADRKSNGAHQRHPRHNFVVVTTHSTMHSKKKRAKELLSLSCCNSEKMWGNNNNNNRNSKKHPREKSSKGGAGDVCCHDERPSLSQLLILGLTRRDGVAPERDRFESKLLLSFNLLETIKEDKCADFRGSTTLPGKRSSLRKLWSRVSKRFDFMSKTLRDFCVLSLN